MEITQERGYSVFCIFLNVSDLGNIFVGVMLHYEDSTLKDLYFLDPQWLCDMLAHVVTIREINPFARNGLYHSECSNYNLV